MRRTKPPKLKQRPLEGGYDNALCAGDGCDAQSDYIDATKRIWSIEIPLCDDCYAKRPDPEPKRIPPTAKPVIAETEDEENDWKDIEDARPVDLSSPKSHKLFG